MPETLFADPAHWLPLVFASLMGLAILIYVCLDGFDLGVGVLTPFATAEERDMMIASIGPFWDANETWLVLAVGLLLVAFPVAHGVVLTALYLPVALMLSGLILRGVAFEFRAKAPAARRPLWDKAFFVGSFATTLAQGYMLGLYIMGLETTVLTFAFACLTALCLTAGYAYIGAAWVLMKTDGVLRMKAIGWARRALAGLVLGFAAISIASPLASGRIFDKWFGWPEMLALAPLPVLAAVLVLMAWRQLTVGLSDFGPFFCGVGLFILAFLGLAYSFFPYVVPDRITIFEAASAPESLFVILIGAVFVVPAILGYTALAYWIFRGKATRLSYD